MIRLLLAWLLLALAGPARADELRPFYLELRETAAGQWDVLWKAPVLGGVAGSGRPLLPGFCRLALARPQLVGGALVAAGTARCTRPLAGARLGVAGLAPGSPDGLIRVAPLDAAVQAAQLRVDAPTITLARRASRWQVAQTYGVIGVEHIVGGIDHLLFVVALVLLLRRGWPVVAAATAFTIAHSITLAGTTLGLFGLPQAPVEAVIALSILFLAVEIVKAQTGSAPDQPRLSQRLPWLVAFLFGLLHGFGFAGALREVGLPAGEVPMALLAFNIGVEAGQLAIIAGASGLLWLLRRLAPAALQPAIFTAAYAIGSTAGYWFIDRL
ncbi:MAG: HupE/UreJ family protein [Alphaproteobacteria bacterium]|nr:HupE/UreJ family protein [Alphaproteobacteria bacterium]